MSNLLETNGATFQKNRIKIKEFIEESGSSNCRVSFNFPLGIWDSGAVDDVDY